MDNHTLEPACGILLVTSLSMGKAAACDITVVHLLNPSLILVASTTVGAAQ